MNKRHASYLLFIVLSFVPNVTNSEMYKWKGKDGTMNFTNDLSTVPDEFRQHFQSDEVQTNKLSEPLIKQDAQIKINALNIVDYGLVESDQPTLIIDAPGTSLGRIIAARSRLINKTDKIRGSVGSKFGIFYIVEGEPELEAISLSVKVTHPPLKNPKKDKPSYSDEWVSSPSVGVRHYEGWIFEYEWETAPGKWTFEISYEGKKLAEKTFTIY